MGARPYQLALIMIKCNEQLITVQVSLCIMVNIMDLFGCITFLIEGFFTVIAIAIAATCHHDQSLESCHLLEQKLWGTYCLYKRGQHCQTHLIISNHGNWEHALFLSDVSHINIFTDIVNLVCCICIPSWCQHVWR